MAVSKMAKGKKVLLIGAISAAALLAVGCAAFLTLASASVRKYDKIYPGVQCLGIALEGKTVEQATMELQAKSAEDFKDKSFRIVYEDYSVEITAAEAGISYNADQMAKNAYNFGRDGWILGRYFYLKLNAGTHEIEPIIERSSDIVEEKVDEFAKLVESDVAAPSYTVVANQKLRIDLGEEGRAISRQQITEDMKTRIEELSFGDYTVETTVTPQEAIDLQKIYDEIYCEATEATIKYVPLDWTEETADQYTEEQLASYSGKRKYVITQGNTGLSFDVAAAQEQIDHAEKRIVIIDLVQDVPEDTTEELKAKIFRDVIGTCTTKLNTGETNRTHNIDLASKAVNGTVLCPGEVFSYNSTVGERTAERGYKEAKIFAAGEVVDGLGGGICQLSSTIYIASLLSNLKPTERYSHRFAVSYTKLGQDATVCWNSLDFKFKNTSNWPIKIEVSRSGGKLTVNIYGTKEDEYTYELSSVKTGTIEYEKKTVYVQIGSSKAKELSLTKLGDSKTVGGITGYTSTTYLIRYLDGKKVDSTWVNDSEYKTQDKTTYIAAYLDKNGKPYTDSKGNLIDPNAKPVETETEPTTETEPDTGTETQPVTPTEP